MTDNPYQSPEDRGRDLCVPISHESLRYRLRDSARGTFLGAVSWLIDLADRQWQSDWYSEAEWDSSRTAGS